MAGIGSIFDALLAVLPWEVAIGLMVVFGLALVPGWLHAMRTRKIKGAVRLLVRAVGASQRQPLLDRIQEQAGSDPRLWEVSLREANKRQQVDAIQQATQALTTLPHGQDLLKAQQAKTARTSPPVRHPLETIAVVEHMIAQGLWVGARDQLAAALDAAPDHAELRALHHRIEAEAPYALDAAEGVR